VTSDITVSEGVILEIEPGVTVKFDGYYRFTERGTIKSIGTEQNPIFLLRTINHPVQTIGI